VGARLHYGISVGDGVVLAAGSFVMKGEEIPDRVRWGGNQAREMPSLAGPGIAGLLRQDTDRTVELHVLAGGGHYFPGTRPEETAQAVMRTPIPAVPAGTR
jgi:tetrahydrodipicolinate N-succinyltransferase